MKTPNPNQTAKQELINANVPKHLHKLVTGLIICIQLNTIIGMK